MLAKIALDDKWKYGIVREAAVGRLTDQELLVKIATGDDRYGKGLSPEVIPRLRTVAVERLLDQAALAQVALEAAPADSTKYGYVRMNATILRMAAIRRLTDQGLLSKVALESKAGDARKAAAEALTDQTLLVRVMLEDKDLTIRTVAQEHLAKDLVLAVTTGDLPTVTSLAKTLSVNLRDNNGKTLLMLASELGKLDVVKLLLEMGADVNAENVIADYVQMPNGARAYAGSTTSTSEIAARFPGSVIIHGKTQTALTFASNSQVIQALLVEAGAK